MAAVPSLWDFHCLLLAARDLVSDTKFSASYGFYGSQKVQSVREVSESFLCTSSSTANELVGREVRFSVSEPSWSGPPSVSYHFFDRKTELPFFSTETKYSSPQNRNYSHSTERSADQTSIRTEKPLFLLQNLNIECFLYSSTNTPYHLSHEKWSRSGECENQ